MEKIRPIEVFKLAISILVCQLAGFLGSFFTRPSIETWYATLKKPPFTPPNWLFAPVWITLYALMGVSLFLVWREGLNHKKVRAALGIFVLQLALNTVWSMVFFGLRSPFAGLIEIAVLWIAVVATILYFFRISRTAGLLLIPYILWVSFAVVLNFYISKLNI